LNDVADAADDQFERCTNIQQILCISMMKVIDLNAGSLGDSRTPHETVSYAE